MKAPAKVKPRRHGRAALKQSDNPDVLKVRDAAVLRFDRAFRQQLPQHERSGQNAVGGSYSQVEGDAYDGQEYPIADGAYRVQGSEWVHTFEGGGYVGSVRAEAPHFGGKNVIAIEQPLPGRPGSNG